MPGISLGASSFNSKLSSQVIGQHDARSLGNDLFSYYDNNSHTTSASQGGVFRVYKSGNTQRAVMAQLFVNPTGRNSLCTGSNRKKDLDNTVVGWGCSLNAITLIDKSGKPIVSIDKIKTPETSGKFSYDPLIYNNVDRRPDFDYQLAYRVLPILNP